MDDPTISASPAEQYGEYRIEIRTAAGGMQVWMIDPFTAAPVTDHLIRAIACGEVTVGGMAEAGWFPVGKLSEDGVK